MFLEAYRARAHARAGVGDTFHFTPPPRYKVGPPPPNFVKKKLLQYRLKKWLTFYIQIFLRE